MAFHKKLSEDGKPHETIIYCDNIQQIYPFTKKEKKISMETCLNRFITSTPNGAHFQ